MPIFVDDLGYGDLSSYGGENLQTPHIDKLADDCNVSLAVSLHAPNDELRDKIVPINKLHPIDELLDACWRYAAKHANRFITFEYVMLKGVNDSDADARRPF